MADNMKIGPQAGKCPETNVKANIENDLKKGVLAWENDSLFSFDAKKYEKQTGKDLTLGEIKCRYDIGDGKLAKGEAGEANSFYMGSFGTGSYDDQKPIDLKKPIDFIIDKVTGETPVYIPNGEIAEHLGDKKTK